MCLLFSDTVQIAKINHKTPLLLNRNTATYEKNTQQPEEYGLCTATTQQNEIKDEENQSKDKQSKKKGKRGKIDHVAKMGR